MKKKQIKYTKIQKPKTISVSRKTTEKNLGLKHTSNKHENIIES